MSTVMSKIRRAIPILIAIASVPAATGPVVPYAQARPNTGGYQHSGEAHKKQLGDAGCQSLKEDSNYNSDKASDAYAAGNAALGKSYQRAADADYQAAKNGGCAWAIW